MAKPMTQSSTVTNGSGGTSRSQHTQAQTIRNKRLLEERDPAVRRRNHDELRRQADDPALARKFLLRTALFESLREAEQIA